MQPKPKTRKQISLLRKLTKEAEQIVHAGDPDREGQLLVDEVLDYLKVTAAKRKKVQRCLINDLNPTAVTRAIGQLRPNSEFIPLATSALARSRADWLYGLNMTRAYTLQGRMAGYNGVLSVGRVQTPVLGLVARRDQEIEAFTPKPFYELLAHVTTADGQSFTAKWVPSDACSRWQDEEGRVLSKALAENVAARIQCKDAQVESVDKKDRSTAAPLPYNLSSLQIDANKRHSMSAQKVLDLCQSLYEKHKLITYPRSDCRYLPEEHLAEALAVSEAIMGHCPELGHSRDLLDLTKRSKAWNNKKVEAHHAIIPTSKRVQFSKLSEAEQQVYGLIARQYLIQFMPLYRYAETQVRLTIEGGLFTRKAVQLIEPGWKVLFKNTESDEPLLPKLREGEVLVCERGEVIEKITQPPKYFTEATLLSAMTGIARFVEDQDTKKILKETDGLGTEATRAGIIELLFKRQFLQRQGKTIKATDAGKALIAALPDSASKPDMTARWEASLDAISSRRLNYTGFMQPLEMQLQELIAQAATLNPTLLKGIQVPQRNNRKGKGAARKGRNPSKR